MEFSRYAIFYIPGPGPFAEFGAAWLGWDVTAGARLPTPHTAPLPLAWDEITRTPRRYGFHGTIKPPFRLAENQSPDILQQSFVEFCSNYGPVSLSSLELAQLGRFLALVPVGNASDLNTLAAEAVRYFDPFRAPLGENELARRRKSHLTPRQDVLLQSWGYPYVLEEFRFHLTLTGKLPKAKAGLVRELLAPLLAPLLPVPFEIDALSLMGEDENGMFHLIERLPLSGQD